MINTMHYGGFGRVHCRSLVAVEDLLADIVTLALWVKELTTWRDYTFEQTWQDIPTPPSFLVNALRWPLLVSTVPSKTQFS